MTEQPAAGHSILIVEDDPTFGLALQTFLRQQGCAVRAATTVAQARSMLEAEPAAIAFVDFRLPDGAGPDVVKWALGHQLVHVSYCMTGYAACENVVQAMRAGCLDVLEKPFNLEKIKAIVSAHCRSADDSTLPEWRTRFAPQLQGEDPALIEVLTMIRNVSDTDCTVLVTGESGTGKELVARAVHDSSARAEGPFVALNCAAIPETLIEAELFGHARGAFTGANVARDGRIAAADGGTLFLDEIGDMPLAAQAKLLRVLQDHTIMPVGSDHPVRVNVRIVAATNKDLEQMVEAATFRADLYFRISVIRLRLPRLQERPDDILPLARYFLSRVNQRTKREVVGFDDSAQLALCEYPWPGNVRELANVIERGVLVKGKGTLTVRDLGLPGKRGAQARGAAAPAAPVTTMTVGVSAGRPASGSESLNLRAAIDDVERQFIEQALERTGGNRTEAAALLGLNRTTLVEKLRKLGG